MIWLMFVAGLSLRWQAIHFNPLHLEYWKKLKKTTVSLSYYFSQHHFNVFFRLEKEYTALKSKENEDQIELRVSNA